MKTEKKYLIYGIGLVLIVLIGVTFAYFTAQIIGDTKEISVSIADLKVIFTNGEAITGEEIEPGWSITKTFSVENKTKGTYKYNIVIEDLINTFKTEGYLVYKITSTNDGYNMTDYKDVPKSATATDTILAYSVEIPVGVKQEYTIEIKYINSETEDQSIDMGSTLSGNLYITEGTLPPTLYDKILADNPTVSTRTDFSVTNTANTTGTIYTTTATEDGSTVYYYSGNTTNNWVQFGKIQEGSCTYNGVEVMYVDLANEYSGPATSEAECHSTYMCTNGEAYVVGVDEATCTSEAGGTYLTEQATWNVISEVNFYWRIIRTNEDGSVRLLYSGTSPDTTSGYIGTSAFNSSYNDPMNVGYMYGTTGSLANNRTNTNDSTIKQTIDTWYENNLLANYDKYISKTAIYCNDRSVGRGTYNTGSTEFYFGAYTRLATNKTPTYKCGGNTSGGLFEDTQAVEDKFSASTEGGGNGKLKYPIALMTSDEVAFAGGVYDTILSSPYAWYYTNSTGGSITGESLWRTMAPYRWDGSGSGVWDVSGSYSPGYLGYSSVDYSSAVRASVSLKSCNLISKGDGTASNPYEINYVESCTE